MKIVIPDDYQDCIRHLDCYSKLGGHEVVIHNDTISDVDELVRRFGDAEALVLIRERTRITPTLLDRLPKLKIISQTGKVSNHLKVADCSARGIAVAEGQGDPVPTAELTWALIMGALRHVP